MLEDKKKMPFMSRIGIGATLLALLSISALITACGGGDDPASEPESTATEPTDTTIAEPTDTAPTTTTIAEPTDTAPTTTTAIEPTDIESEDDAFTRAYVMEAVERYERDGLDAVIEHYNDLANAADGRLLYLVEPETGLVRAHPLQVIRGVVVAAFSPDGQFADVFARADEEGIWFDTAWVNVSTREKEPARFFIVREDGLIFMSAHYIVKENVADTTKEYIARAMEYYDDNGLDATISHYNSRDSMDGQFYLFLIGEDEIYLVHPFIPDLIGTDIKDVVGKDIKGNDGYELGKEIARATEEGIWVEYLWPDPLTLKEQTKVTWAIRHDGLVFASGYYTGREEPGVPAWATADPEEYTVQYVDRAIERYKQYGLESVEAYYNSVASFEGEFYLFATDSDGIYTIHPLISDLIGTDIKDVVGKDIEGNDGYELGKEIAQATEEGIWVEYLWPYPATLSDAPKVAYAKRHDGYVFASGYYPLPENAEEVTRAYIDEAIAMYESDGLDPMVAHYDSRESIDGQWFLYVIDSDEKFIVNGLMTRYVGKDAASLGETVVSEGEMSLGAKMLQATEEGHRFSNRYFNTRGAGALWLNSLAVRHDGLIFGSSYFTPRPSGD